MQEYHRGIRTEFSFMIWDRWREKILDPFEEYQEKARLQWMALKPRERWILGVTAVVMSFLIVVLVIREVNQFFFSHTLEAESNMKNVDTIERMASELLQQKGQMLRYEQLK